MSKKTTWYFIVIALGAVLLYFSWPLPYLPILRPVEDTVTLTAEEAVSLAVTTETARINIEPSRDSEAVVTLSGRSNRKLSLEQSSRGDQTEIEVSDNFPGWFNWGKRTKDLIVSVSLPAGFAEKLELKSVSGSLKLTDIDVPELELKSVSGRIELSDIRSSQTDLETVSGNVNLHEVLADRLTVKTTSGSVKAEVPTGSLEIRSVSGEVTASVEQLQNPIKITTVSGAITVSVPESAHAAVSLSSVSGRLSSAHPLGNNTSAAAQALSGMLGEGSHEISLRSTSGSIRLQQHPDRIPAGE